MLTRPLDTIFCSADRMRDAIPSLLRETAPGGRLHRSLTGLLAALDQFEADLVIGPREQLAETGREVSVRKLS